MWLIKTVTPKILCGPPMHRDRLNTHPYSGLSHICFRELQSGDLGGQSIRSILFWQRKILTTLARYEWALSPTRIKIGQIALQLVQSVFLYIKSHSLIRLKSWRSWRKSWRKRLVRPLNIIPPHNVTPPPPNIVSYYVPINVHRVSFILKDVYLNGIA